MSNITKDLLANGVVMPAPETVEVDASVSSQNIAPGVVIHADSRLRGESLSIGPGCVIGEEAPATVVDCQLERDVELKGGYFEGSVFLDGASMGSSAHVRPGTLLEEQASGAHAVGLKQTIFLSYVTAGSLINFCDALMTGGTDRRNHSEIGSSYIHFNYTPHQDKATASLVGDVPRGVMLDQPPIFLGGQGGLVGPSRLTFGCVIPAGTIYRRDALNKGQLLLEPAPRGRGERPYALGLYGNITRIVTNNLHYLGNVLALRAWYQAARQPFMDGDVYARACYAGAIRQLNVVAEERVKRLGDLAGKMKASLALGEEHGLAADAIASQERLMTAWPVLHDGLRELVSADHIGEAGEKCLAELRAGGDKAYLDAVRDLSEDAKAQGTVWLQAIVDRAVALWGS